MKRNIVEWAVLVVSVIGIVLLVGVLVVEGLSESRPADPQVELRTGEGRAATLGWIIPAEVRNGGDEPAEAVMLEATTMVDGAEEVTQLEVNYLPAGTTVDVAFAFSARPQGDIRVRLVGYRVP